jgi:hypothetical protein
MHPPPTIFILEIDDSYANPIISIRDPNSGYVFVDIYEHGKCRRIGNCQPPYIWEELYWEKMPPHGERHDL